MRALFLSPHNDDEVLFGTFTLLRYRPHVVICLRSERMGDPSYPGNMPVDAKTREFETEIALKTLAIDGWTQWPITDNAPDPEQLEAFMIGLRDPSGADDWDIVFAPWYEDPDGHPDHNLVGRTAASVFADVPITWYLTYTRNGRSTGTEVEYELEWIALKHHALACYKSQSAHPATYTHFMGDLREYTA